MSIPVRTVLKLATCAAAIVLFSSCLSDSVDPTIDLNATPLPGTAITAPTATSEPAPTAMPTVAPWLPPLVEPGPPALISPSIFFLNGPDAWLVGSDLAVRQVTERLRVRLVATQPGALSAAVLLIESEGGRETEEIRIIDEDGNESEPIYGPEIVGDPVGNPRVALLRWSPDGQRLAIVRDDGSIWLTGPASTATALDLQQPAMGIEDLSWSPSGAAFVILYRSASNTGALRVVPIDTAGGLDLAPLGSFGTVCWPAGQSTLIVSEDRSAGQNPNAGSLFTIQANGANRELLMSAGEFGPAIRIGQMLPSPDGTQLAYTIETPGSTGEFTFQALYVLEISSGILRQLDVASGYAVSDLWWFESGLLWRAIDSDSNTGYNGVEPFIIESADLESGESKLIYTNDGA